jgi:hypothetical protein
MRGVEMVDAYVEALLNRSNAVSVVRAERRDTSNWPAAKRNWRDLDVCVAELSARLC